MRTFAEAYEGKAKLIHDRYIKKLAIVRICGIVFALAIGTVTVLFFNMYTAVASGFFLIMNVRTVIKIQHEAKTKEFIPQIIPALYEITREKMSVNELNDSNLMRIKAGSALEYKGTMNVEVDYHKFKIHDITIVRRVEGRHASIFEGGLLISTPEEFSCRAKLEPDMSEELEAISLGIEATGIQKELINMNASLTAKMKNIMVELTPMEINGPFRVYADEHEAAARLVDEKYLNRLANMDHKISIYLGNDKFYALIHDVHFADENEPIKDSYDKVYGIVKRLEMLLPFDRS